MTSNYPIFIPSKGRYNNNLTANLFNKYNIDYKLVVEDCEFNQYKDIYGKEKIIKLDDSNYGHVAYVRNYIKKYATTRGFKRCWQIDDDIKGVMKRTKDGMIEVNPLEAIKCVEQITDKFSNIGISGLSSNVFGKLSKNHIELNKSVYSFWLLNLKLNFMFKPNTMEDIDYNLRCLVNSYCTLRFTNYLFKWTKTESQKGGNTEHYAGKGKDVLHINTYMEWSHIVKIKNNRVKVRWNKFKHIPKTEKEQ